jgi:NAD/NADP transhydrogenase alpha subunit
MQAILGLLVKDGELVLDWDDEIVAGACVTRKEVPA